MAADERCATARAHAVVADSCGARLWRLVVSTVGTCMRNRVTGLAAEAAFFAVLSLPPLVFALAGSIGYVFAQFSDTPDRRGPRDGALDSPARR